MMMMADGSKASLPMKQPFFASQMIATSVGIAEGATVLIGGGMNHASGDRTLYTFLTARRVDVQGKPYRSSRDE